MTQNESLFESMKMHQIRGIGGGFEKLIPMLSTNIQGRKKTQARFMRNSLRGYLGKNATRSAPGMLPSQMTSLADAGNKQRC
jgi:hypothetical protein